MSSFKPGQFNVKADPSGKSEPRVVKLDVPTEPVIQKYEFGKLERPGEGSYSSVKAKYGALAATDPDRKARSRKDARFCLNPLLRDPLAVEEEERRAIEERVKERVRAIEEETRAIGIERGFEAGKKQGFEEAYRSVREEAEERLRRFDQFLMACEHAKDEIFKANERFLIELSFRIAKTIALKEVSADPEYVTRLARELVQRLGVRENIKIKVHPDDFETAGRLKENLEQTLGELKNFQVESSQQIELGGCMLESEWNAIDARIETQLQGLYEGILGANTGDPESVP